MAPDNGNNRDDDPPLPPHVVGGEPTEPELVLNGPGSDDEPTDSSSSDGLSMVPLEELDEDWTPYFRYDMAYQDQVDAIETFVDLLAGNGYYVLEGACGTGKTLAAMTAGIHSIRDRGHLTKSRVDDGEFPDYSRMLVVTPVKQQLRQFVREMRGINRSLPDGESSVPTVVLRGRPDMMPYSYVDLKPFDEHGLGRMDDLREMARELIRFDSDIPLDWPDGMTPPEFSYADYDWENASETAEQHRDRYRYDPFRAKAVKRIVEDMEVESGDESDRLVVNGVRTPYPELVPHTNDVVDTDVLQRRGTGQLPVDLQGKFDPFYVGFFSYEDGLPFGFRNAEDYVFDQEELFVQAASRGMCPHETMAKLAGMAEVVLGNYNHLFDPQTRLLTDDKIGLLDSDTIAVVDEAHQVERRVRDMLSMSLDVYTLNRAINDIRIARQYAIGEIEKTPTPELDASDSDLASALAEGALDTVTGYSVTVEDLSEVEDLLRFAKQKLAEYGSECLNEEFSNISWQEAVRRWQPDDQEKPLSKPNETDDTDEFLGDAVAEGDFDTQSFLKVYPAMLAVKFVYEALEKNEILDRTPQSVEIGKFFKRWVSEDSVEYHREVVLDVKRKDSVPSEYPEWVTVWTPKFQLFNCIPRDELRAVFGELGGGVLMSATLQPEDVFKEAVGVNNIPHPAEEDEGEDDEDDNQSGGEVPTKPSAGSRLDEDDVRPTTFEQYPLRFPEENRLSLTVDLPKYTSTNRGKLVQDYAQMSNVRKQYADMLEEAVATQGNILVAMPNYREAKWAYEYLKDKDISKRFHLDQSSPAMETDRTLESFFAEGEAVIFTSSRSTITEGVDYDQEKLHGCIAVGIPLLPTNSPRIEAVKTAYDKRISTGSGFETALTIPAVRKVRQAFGRVIRGSDEAGIRLLLDERYGSTAWDGVKEYLSEQEQAEFSRTRPEQVTQVVSAFWDDIAERDLQSSSHGTSEETSTSDSQQQEQEPSSATTPGETEVKGDREQESEATGDTEAGPTSYSKIYFGDGATLSGWTPIETDVAENEIIPLVREHEVDDDSEDTIQLNFASELSASGWTKVRSDVVLDRIEPIAKEARQ